MKRCFSIKRIGTLNIKAITSPVINGIIIPTKLPITEPNIARLLNIQYTNINTIPEKTILLTRLSFNSFFITTPYIIT